MTIIWECMWCQHRFEREAVSVAYAEDNPPECPECEGADVEIVRAEQ